MMTLLIFTIGIVLGWAANTLFTKKRTSNGYFSIEPYDMMRQDFIVLI